MKPRYLHIPRPKPGESLPLRLEVLACRCARCDYEWTTRDAETPGWCPGCKSKSWRSKAGTVRRGRPPLAR